MPQEAFEDEEFCSAQDVEDCGLQVRGFGVSGTHLPVSGDVLEAAIGLGFAADEEHAWATCDDDAAFGGRGQKRQVRAWRWQTAAEILRGNDWGQEDKDFIRKQ